MNSMRTVSRRQALKLGAAATGLAALAAVDREGALGGETLAASKKEKVTVVVSEDGAEFLPAVIDRWNKYHPYIRIQTTQSTADTGKLAAQLASGTGPDTIRLYGAGELATYVVRGVAMNITSRIKADHSAYPPSEFEKVDSVFRFNGTSQGSGPWYGMPKDWSQDYMLWYNREVFRKAGIPEPSATEPMTWEKVFSVAKELTGKGRFGLGYWAGSTQLDASLLLLQMAQKKLRPWGSDHSKANFNTPEVADIVQTWVDDVVKTNLGPNSVNGSTAQVLSDFPAGKVAMILCGYWYSGDIRQAFASSKNNIALAPAPVFSGGRRISPTGAATGAIINAQTKHPDETWQVFSYLYGKQYAELVRAESGWGLPTFSSRWNALPHDTAWDRGLLDVQQRELKYFGILDYNPYAGIDALNSVMSTYINPLYFGKSTVRSALSQMDQELDRTIQATRRSVG